MAAYAAYRYGPRELKRSRGDADRAMIFNEMPARRGDRRMRGEVSQPPVDSVVSYLHADAACHVREPIALRLSAAVIARSLRKGTLVSTELNFMGAARLRALLLRDDLVDFKAAAESWRMKVRLEAMNRLPAEGRSVQPSSELTAWAC